MAEYLITDTELTSIANVIRTKNNTFAPIVYPAGFVTAIENISTGINVSDTTASDTDVLSGKNFYTSDGLLTQGAIPLQTAQVIIPGTSDQIITSGKYLAGNQTIKGDANLIATNITKYMTIFGVTGTYDNGSDAKDKIVGRTISGTYENSRVSKIGSYAFCSCSSLSAATFQNCTLIEQSAFYNCTKLTYVSFPLCLTIDSCAFRGCTSLSTASFPNCTSIGYSAFSGCTRLTTANFPACLDIGNNAFYSCSKLSSISFMSCMSVRSSAFYYCIKLETVSFPNCSTIASSAFANCYKLTSVYLTGSSIVKLAHSSAFRSTPIAGYTTSTGGVYGSIYVPMSLLDTYKSSTNWSYFSSRFVGI